MPEDNKKRVVVISGGMGYVGMHISDLLIQDGFTVCSIDKETVDITDEQAVEKFALETKKHYGNIEVLIHAAAAPLIRKPVLSLTEESFRYQLEVTLTGAFNLSKHFKSLMTKNGCIIGLTSGAIEAGSYSPTGSYIPAKYALKGLLRALYNELKGEIRVYAVSPAFMPGGLNSDIPEKALDFITQKSKPGEVTHPDKVAKTILGLLNDTLGKMNGKQLSVPSGAISDL